jgi:4'-phosphopantetheinyl transferase
MQTNVRGKSSDWVIAAPVEAVHDALGYTRVLDEAEQARALRFLRREDEERYRAAHLLKRHMLGVVYTLAAQDLKFGVHTGGKPYLVSRVQQDFSLSHAGAWVSVGISRSGHIGVDVEAERPAAFWRDIADMFLASSERAVDAECEFLKIWTAKEAGLKAHGAGFAIMPNTITVDRKGDGFAFAVEMLSLRGVWRTLDDMHMLAVAFNGRLPEIVVCRSGADLKAAIDGIRSLLELPAL